MSPPVLKRKVPLCHHQETVKPARSLCAKTTTVDELDVIKYKAELLREYLENLEKVGKQ
jgi:hypothetical protein